MLEKSRTVVGEIGDQRGLKQKTIADTVIKEDTGSASAERKVQTKNGGTTIEAKITIVDTGARIFSRARIIIRARVINRASVISRAKARTVRAASKINRANRAETASQHSIRTTSFR